MDELKLQLVLISSAIVVRVIACAFFVPDSGIMGAAMAEIVSMLVNVILGIALIAYVYLRAKRIEKI
jgi:uncharacterized membrane protein YozB (DUF420 family)